MLTRLMQVSTLVLALGFAVNVYASDYTEPSMTPATASEPGPDLSNGSEYLYQSEAHKFEVTPHVGFGSTVTKYSQNNLKRIEGFFPIGAEGEYGINEMFAVGIDLTYLAAGRTYKCDTTPCPENSHSTGLANPTLRFKGRNHTSFGTIRYGADLDLSVEKYKIGSSHNTNVASGGTTLTPWVGFEHKLGPGFIGGKIQYDLYKADRKASNDAAAEGTTATDPAEPPAGVDSSISKGQTLALTVFYEVKIKKFTIGAAATYSHREESRTSIAGAASTPNRDQGSGTNLKIYAPIQLTERIALLPAIMINAASYSNSNVIDAAATFGAGCGGRFTF